MAGPKFRLVAVNKDKNKRVGSGMECGTIWPGNYPGSLNLSPVKESTDGPYPKISLVDVINGGEHFINVYPVGEDDLGDFS